jgi:hypothetical protein
VNEEEVGEELILAASSLSDGIDTEEGVMRRDELERTSAWGRVQPRRCSAIDDALIQMRRLASSTHCRQIGATRIEEVRTTPTGYQARVSADLKKMADRR